MIDHYHVTFKGHRCALVSVPSLGADWLLRTGRRETEHQWMPSPTDTPKERQKELGRLRRCIRTFIDKTDADRQEFRNSLLNDLGSVKRLLTDAPDHRKLARRWKIVGVHCGRIKDAK